MRRLITVAVFIITTMLATPARAQNIDLGVDLGKAFSIVDGRFVLSTIPSITFMAGPFELSTSTYLEGSRFFEQDTHLSWYQRASTTRRWSLFASLSHYKWPGGSDLNGQGGLRWRLR